MRTESKTTKSKVTKTQSKAALKVQSPSTPTKSKLPNRKIVQLKEAFGYEDSSGDEKISMSELTDEVFYIKSAKIIPTKFGENYLFKIEYNDEPRVFWAKPDDTRDQIAQAVKEAKRKEGADLVGPFTVVQVPSDNGLNPYCRIVPCAENGVPF